jgi:hypothetical protein
MSKRSANERNDGNRAPVRLARGGYHPYTPWLEEEGSGGRRRTGRPLGAVERPTSPHRRQIYRVSAASIPSPASRRETAEIGWRFAPAMSEPGRLPNRGYHARRSSRCSAHAQFVNKACKGGNWVRRQRSAPPHRCSRSMLCAEQAFHVHDGERRVGDRHHESDFV